MWLTLGVQLLLLTALLAYACYRGTRDPGGFSLAVCFHNWLGYHRTIRAEVTAVTLGWMTLSFLTPRLEEQFEDVISEAYADRLEYYDWGVDVGTELASNAHYYGPKPERRTILVEDSSDDLPF